MSSSYLWQETTGKKKKKKEEEEGKEAFTSYLSLWITLGCHDPRLTFFKCQKFYLNGEGNGNHSHILAWRIPWTDEPGGLQATGSQRI